MSFINIVYNVKEVVNKTITDNDLKEIINKPDKDIVEIVKLANLWKLAQMRVIKLYNCIGYKFNLISNYYLKLGGNSYE